MRGNNVYFVATGVTDGEVLRGVRYSQDQAVTQSLSMRSSSGAVRTIETKHRLSTSTLVPPARSRSHRGAPPDDRHRDQPTGGRPPAPTTARNRAAQPVPVLAAEGLIDKKGSHPGPGKAAGRARARIPGGR